MKNESGLSKNQIIAELTKSPHGALHEYIPTAKAAAEQHGEFFAHLISWNRVKGQVDDAKLALPAVSLFASGYPEEFVENSLAHLTMLNPRDMLKVLRFVLDLRAGKAAVIEKTTTVRGGKKQLQKKLTYVAVPAMRLRSLTRFSDVLAISLLEREKNWPRWERTMLQHRRVLQELFGILHVKPNNQKTKACLYRSDKVDGKRIDLPYPQGGLFEAVSHLKDMSAAEAAGTIMTRKIPFLVALGALGPKSKEPDLVLALIKSMTATELVTNTKMLEDLGIKTNPALRGAFQEALEKAGKSKANLLKTTTAAEAMDDEDLKARLQGLQEKQIQAHGGIDGNWLVLGDKSPSMAHSVEFAKEVAGTLTKMVKGRVWLVFFDSLPMTVDVTGLTLDQIKKATKHIGAGGSGTSIGAGLQRMLDEKAEVDGIAVVSDGGENGTPYFAQTYQKYCKLFDKEPTVYFYQCSGDHDVFSNSMKSANLDMQTFDLRNASPADRYSLPNLVSTMRCNRYSMADEIMATKLLQLSDAYKHGTVKTASA
jgi:hypothetical protein